MADAKGKKHFPATKESLLHFERHLGEATCAYPDKGADKGMTGPCDYRGRDTKVRVDPSVYHRHHILPVGSIQKYRHLESYTEPQRKSINRVFAETKWCSSCATNIIVLARKELYWGSKAKHAAPEVPAVVNLPCHLWDHDKYNDEVTVVFHQMIWQKIKKVAKKKVCTEAEKVEADIHTLEDFFRGELSRRGQRSGGTASGRRASVSARPPKDWWLTFSMADDVVARSRPAMPVRGRELPDPQWESKSKQKQVQSLVNAWLKVKP